ncbi:MAG: extracellular solute-binding protein [Verrucomicrobiota bacterium]
MKEFFSSIKITRESFTPEVIRNLAVLLALIITIAAPFVLRPAKAGYTRKPDQTLVILSPHNETIRAEISSAFYTYILNRDDQRVRLDWRTPGGTSEIEKFIDSSFRASFENYWTKELGNTWSESDIGDAFNSRKVDPAGDSPGSKARRAFLDSNVGIGVDLFFGGGEYPFVVQAEKGNLVDSGIFERRSEWFTDDIIPAEVSGERFYDPDHRWVGNCLSSFGIVYNVDSLARLGIENPPAQWSDLGDPRLFRQVALADPTKSGSATKAFEMLIQQKMHEAALNLKRKDFETEEEFVDRAVRRGWIDGLNLIQSISANARYFTDSSAKIPLDVAQGNAAAGMCIDFYGRTMNELLRKPDGTSRVLYFTPLGGSSFSVDPFGVFRGAPQPELALDFMEFLLSEEGQKIWNNKAGTPGGPERRSLRRLPVRKDIYTEENLVHFADPEEFPYETAVQFQYVRDWTSPAFDAIRFILRCMVLDAHEELQEAWQVLIENDFPPDATRTFYSVGFVDYDKSLGYISDRLKSGYKPSEVTLARQLTNQFRSNYRRAIRMAERGQ